MENEQERKQAAARRVPVAELNQVSSHFAIAMASQEQERAFTVLTTIASESSEEEDQSNHEAVIENEEEGNLDNGYEYFERHPRYEFENELEFLEGQDSNSSDDEMEDDDYDIDVDDLTYEELIALGEFIGEETRGLSLIDISKCLQACTYFSSIESKSGIDRCVICQVEFEEGEAVVGLPCEHPYHSECISNWLQVKKICPICNNEVSPSNIGIRYS